MNEKRQKILEEFRKRAIEFNINLFDSKEPLKNPNAQIKQELNNQDYVKALYKNILLMDINNSDQGFLYWMGELERGASKEQIENYFRQVALRHNSEQGTGDKFENLLDKNDKKRILVILPESIGDIFLATSLFESIRERYPRPEWAFYFATQPQYFDILDGNPYVDKIIPYFQEMDNLFWGEGISDHKGFFDIVYPLHFGTQRLINYTHNGIDVHGLELTKK